MQRRRAHSRRRLGSLYPGRSYFLTRLSAAFDRCPPSYIFEMTHACGLLRRAAELVAGGWTQGADARTADGAPIEPWSDEAAAWSLLGALVAALEEGEIHEQPLPLTELAVALAALAEFVDDDSLVRWNDAPERTAAQVEAALAAAATAAEHSACHTADLSQN
jgi:hypothetical protein